MCCTGLAPRQAQHTLLGNNLHLTPSLTGVVANLAGAWPGLPRWLCDRSCGFAAAVARDSPRISSQGCGGQKQPEDILGGLRWPETARGYPRSARVLTK